MSSRKVWSLMLAGRRFKLREPIIATAAETNGRMVAWVVPSSSVIEIISLTASGLRMLDVLWDGKVLAMQESDIAERGVELFDPLVGQKPAAVAGYAWPRLAKAMRAASH